MPNWLLALILKPFLVAAFLAFVWLVHYLVWKLLPNGWLKALLLRPIGRRRH
jgi:hypothetical protein